MRITNSHRGHATNSAKCAKMTEGEHRIHGMNGVTDSGSAAVKEESPHTSDAYNLGGRLKFFKDGRFILELARAREGEKGVWVPVPKKTFWPPQGSAPSVSAYRQESSTSLSVSDDNSSVQSSPWQRDHTWKQTSPQRNASSHLSFYFRRGGQRPPASCWRYRLQRTPYKPTADPRTKCARAPCYKCNSSRCVTQKSAMATATAGATLALIVQTLWNKSPHALNSLTSPRKRILRELERVTIDDLSYKRCRGKQLQSQPKVTKADPSIPRADSLGPKVDAGNGSAEVINGASPDEQRGGGLSNNNNNSNSNNNNNSSSNNSSNNSSSVPKNYSYSITSLLSGKVECREEKLSSQFVPVSRISAHESGPGSSATISYPQDTVDGTPRTVDIMASKRSPLSEHYGPPPPSPHTYPYMSPYAVYPVLGHHHHPHHHHHHQHHSYVSPYYSAGAYGRGGAPGYYPSLAHSTHSTHSTHPSVPPPIDHAPSPYSWTVPPNTYDHSLHRDDSDVPLNLSKHAD